jgi:hypothetical protein
VTFWQVTADLLFSTSVVMQAAGLTSQDLANLRKIIAAGG